MKNKEQYAEWKKLAWRFGRVFFATFFVILGSGITNVNDEGALKALLVSAASGGISALFKYLREGKEYDQLIHKLPL